jgi:hypothetical protein
MWLQILKSIGKSSATVDFFKVKFFSSNIGLWLEIAAISLCVVSIWLPGSPFDPTNPELAAAPPGMSEALLRNI